eukprot:Phypoly_transcript_24385.p1 GENE.Phypoly_transcript_24385~~Phypoly_transcript_24385.p1  ORF type:complete len:110 (+),score=30.02 Phypoly_transcript_24385:158-487(+)
MSSKGKRKAADSEVKFAKKETKKTKTTGAPLTKKEFTDNAGNLTIQISSSDGKLDTQLTAKPKGFATGSFGWNASDKLKITVDGKELLVQVSLNFTVVGSKEEGKEDDE